MKIFVREKSFYKTFFAISLSIALQNIIVYSVNMADNVMLGTYNEISLAAVALANQIQFVLQMLVIGIGSGVMVISSRYWGRKEVGVIKKTLGVGLILGIAISFLLLILVLLFPRNILSILTNETQIIDECCKYLEIICFSYIFFAISNILVSSLRSVETVKIGFIASAIAFCVNVSLNYILIYGKFGSPEFGIRGAAVATLSARIIECIVVIFYVKFIDKKLLIKFRDLLKFNKEFFMNFIRVALPIASSDALWGIAITVQAAVLGHMGASVIAANSIAIVLFQILTVLCFGAANASAVIIGKTIGENKIESAKQYAKTMQVLYIIIGIIAGILLIISKDFILGFYAISQETKILASQFIIVIASFTAVTSYETGIIVGILRGAGSAKFGLFMDLISMWFVALPISIVAAFVLHLPSFIVYICLRLNQFVNAIIGFFKVNKGNWIKNLEV
mgnify:CR=1 FL=1